MVTHKILVANGEDFIGTILVHELVKGEIPQIPSYKNIQNLVLNEL